MFQAHGREQSTSWDGHATMKLFFKIIHICSRQTGMSTSEHSVVQNESSAEGLMSSMACSQVLRDQTVGKLKISALVAFRFLLYYLPSGPNMVAAK